MVPRSTARVAAVLAFFLLIAATAAETAQPTGSPVFDATVRLVEKNFFNQSALPAFRAEVAAVEAEAAIRSEPFTLDEAIDRILKSLGATHTARYTADSVDYYELSDVFRHAIRDNLRRLYRPEGKITYEGIGIASKEIGDKVFVTDVYDGHPAARAGLMAGDEILSADGAPFGEIASFKGKAGKTVNIEVQRMPGAPPMTFAVSVVRMEPQDDFLDAITNSVKVIERDGRKIGLIHLWSYTSDEVTNILASELGGRRLANVEGLVLDLRSRWGGAPADAAEIFVGGTGNMTMTERDGDIRYVNTRWRKPVVAIIDEGTRSGMEILAYALKRNGIPLVGTRTAGAVVAGTGYLLPDDSFLILAVADVNVDGGRLEGYGVTPDIPVPFDVRYAAGADPQMDAALDEMSRQLSAGSVN